MKKYAEILSTEIQNHDFVILPLSLMECHGPHLPLGTDLYIARYFAEISAQVWAEYGGREALLLPEMPLGVGGVELAGTLHSAEETIRHILDEYTRDLLASGLRQGLITSGHAGSRHLFLLDELAGEYRQQGFHWLSITNRVLRGMGQPRFLPELEKALGRPLSTAEKTALVNDGHAGLWETSFMLAAYPGLVRPVYLELPEKQDDEWSGQPALASSELGLAFISVFSQIIAQVLSTEFFNA